MIERFPVWAPGEHGMERRRVYIYLPDEYYEKPKRQYPVLYMFDGHNVFYDEDATYGKSWGMEQYLQKSGRKLMVVALESSRAPDYGRLKEYAPFSFTTEETGGIIGNGDITMDWIVHVLKRTVDTQDSKIRIQHIVQICQIFSETKFFSPACSYCRSCFMT